MKIEGKVSHVKFQSKRNYFSIFSLSTSDKTVIVTGHFPIIYRSLKLRIFGKMISTKKHGKQFQASSYEIVEPETRFELEDFLSSDLIQCSFGLSFSIGQKIGLDYLKRYKDINYCLSKLSIHESEQVKKELQRNIYHLDQYFQKKNVLEELMKLGFSQEISCRIAFSDEPPKLDDIRKNLYSLIERFDLDWKLVDDTSLRNGTGKHAKIRIQAGIYHLLDRVSNEKGHMFIPQNVLDQSILKFLGIKVNLDEELKELEEENKVIRDYKDHVYSIPNYESERNLADNLYRLSQSKPDIPVVCSSFDDSFPYSEEQKKAIKIAVENQVSVISGPAGTGKTTILVKIIDELKNAGYNIQLCAPTGQAAQRMKEVTGFPALTVHRLLQFDAKTKKPTVNRSFPLDKNCFILDEASMGDIKIISYLTDAIKNGSKLVIIGDIHQLPSIGPGKFLQDLIQCKYFDSADLNEVFRQKQTSQILEFATKIRRGETFDFSTLSKQDDFVFYQSNRTQTIQDALVKLVEKFVGTGKYDPFKDLQVITPVNKGPLGVGELNKRIQNVVNPHGNNELVYGNRVFREGDKVIQLQNNYDKHIYNGDTGVIVQINKRNKSVWVEFDSKPIEFYDEELFDMDLAYALTVHKMQGGECPFIFMPFHSCFGSFMLNRKLLYTAVTRAKRQLIMIGDEEAVQTSIENNLSEQRYCNLIPRIKSARMNTLFH